MPHVIGLRDTVNGMRSSMRSGSVRPEAARGMCRVAWPAVARAGLVLLCAGLLGQASWADEAGEPPRWIPSLDFGFTTFNYSADARVQNFINPPWLEGTQNDPAREFQYQIGGELMGPMFEDLPGRPRLFLQGRVQLRQFSADKIFKLGELRGRTDSEVAAFASAREYSVTVQNCETNSSIVCPVTEPHSFTGQGSEVEAQFQNPSWYAALGLAFELPLNQAWLLQVKPSLSYFYDEIYFTGRFRAVNEVDPVNEVFEIHQSIARASTTNHHLGFGLEFALSLFRQDLPIRTWIYADAQFTYLLSDPTTELSDVEGVASYSVTRDRFGIRTGAGLRFSWMGFAGR
jgi:Outer membrane protein beta-barrel domain